MSVKFINTFCTVYDITFGSGTYFARTSRLIGHLHNNVVYASHGNGIGIITVAIGLIIVGITTCITQMNEIPDIGFHIIMDSV